MLFYFIHTHTHTHTCLCVCVHAQFLSHALLFVTPWTIVGQASLSIEFSRQDYWSWLPFPTEEIFPTEGSNPCFWCLLNWQVESLPLCHRKPIFIHVDAGVYVVRKYHLFTYMYVYIYLSMD